MKIERVTHAACPFCRGFGLINSLANPSGDDFSMHLRECDCVRYVCRFEPIPGAPSPTSGEDVQRVEHMLRRHAGMYDWQPREAAAINDFILTVREGLAEEWTARRADLIAAATIDSVLAQLEDAMHFCCDQPLTLDAMSLTRIWRAILTTYTDAIAAQPVPAVERPEASSSC